MEKLKRGRLKMDRLSELPESLILEILSLLNFRDVVKTTLLSKFWQSIWTAVPCLDFHERGKNFDVIRNFVSRALSLWRGTHLRKLSIRSDESAPSFSVDMDVSSWVQFATERKVEDLCIQLYNTSLDQFCPPQCLYECSSIRKLLLYACNLQIHGDVNWDRLNSLKLYDCVVSEDAMNQVFSSSPQLETFTASCRHHPFQNWSIRSSSLKKFWIHSLSTQPSVLTIWAPNLDSFIYNGRPYIKCSITDSKSLTEVQLDFFSGSSSAVTGKVLCEILPAIQHVETAKLSSFCFRILRDIMSPLLNVKQLTFAETLSVDLSDILGLLECFPRLEMLIIHLNYVGKQFRIDEEKYIESKANILESNYMLQLRTIVITCYGFHVSFVEVIGFLLKHATVIEKLVIRKRGKFVHYKSKEKVEITSMLASLQRSFPSVELILC